MEKNNQTQQLVDLKEIAYVMLKNIWLIILLGVIGYVAMYVYAKVTEVPTYTASVSLYVKNTTNKTAMDSVSAGDLSAAKTIAGTYIAVLEDDVVMEVIGDKLLEKYKPEELSRYFSIIYEDGKPKVDESSISSKITIEQVNDTELLRISATTASPTISADICTFITEYAPEQLIRVVGAGSVENVGRIKVPKYSDGSKVGATAKKGLLIGIVIAIIIVYLRYVLDNTINNGETLRAKYDLPMLAEVPFYDVEGTGKAKQKKNNIFTRVIRKFKKENETVRSVRNTINDVEVPFVVTEAYNTFRTNILFAFSTSDNNSNIAVISSTLAGEGKSTSSSNLGISIGGTDARVLLIDADLRKPTQHKLFKVSNEKGLSTVLSGMSSFKDTVNRNISGNLDLLTSGPMPPNPSQMLASEKMTQLLDRVSKEYDYILIDTSPVNIVSDALIIAKQTAGIVLVTKHGQTTFEQIERCLESIRFAGVNVLGCVVNSVNYDNGGIYSKKGYKYYRYNYKYRYNYEYKDDKTKDESKKDNDSVKEKSV